MMILMGLRERLSRFIHSFFKKGLKLPYHRQVIDIKLRKSDLNLRDITNRILQGQGIDNVRKELGLMRTKYEIGYSRKDNFSSVLKLEDFKASLNNDQWIIAIDKVVNDNDLYVITVKGTEVTTVVTLQEAQQIVKKDDVNVVQDEACNLEMNESEICSGTKKKKVSHIGKIYRKKDEKVDDEQLWQQLRTNTPDGLMTRNERQRDRLEKWKTEISERYVGCRALDEMHVKCGLCKVVIQGNKFNALELFGRVHFEKCREHHNEKEKKTNTGKL